jgi:type VI secretion system protein ImpB
MGSESAQQKKGRVRPPRVHITYKVEDYGMEPEIELPFVVGVLADLSGQPEQPLPPLAERNFTYIDKENFDDVLAKATPRLTFTVDNKLTDKGGKIGVVLNFKELADFEPARVAEQVEPLRDLLEMRNSLKEILSKMAARPKLGNIIEDILTNNEKRAALAREVGAQTPPTEGTK